VPTESFFNFFDPPKPPTDEDDASSDIEERLELDYQLGEDIKEKLIPRAIDWFTGEALQYENIEDDFDEGEFEDEDDDDEDELSDDRDEDDESDEEVCRPRSIRNLQTANLFRAMVQNQSRTRLSASRAKRYIQRSDVGSGGSELIQFALRSASRCVVCFSVIRLALTVPHGILPVPSIPFSPRRAGIISLVRKVVHGGARIG